jgi:hypothetical protein
MAYTKLIRQHIAGGQVEEIASTGTYRLTLPEGSNSNYRLAQMDDYAKKSRRHFPWRSPSSLSLAARASSNSIPGTWGFGLWNYPFGMSLGFSEDGFRLPALPNAVWFFHASKENYLSFRDSSTAPPKNGGSAPRKSAGTHLHDLPSKSRAVPVSQREVAANGFLAQTFRAPGFHPLLIPAVLALPFSRKITRRLMGRVIGEDGIRLSVDVTQWHRYRLDWREDRVSFEVDDAPVLESTVSPKTPLGLVIWIDNQYAAFTPQGKIGFGVLENPEPAWLEIKDVKINR